MSLLKSLKKRLVYQFIAIVIYETTCDIKVQRLKNGEIVFEEAKSFEIESKEKLNDTIIDYLDSLQEIVEQTYLALFLNTHGQGVVPSCAKSVYDKFHIDFDSVKHVCINNDYSIYASLIDIKWVEKIFDHSGLDFVFSPFLVLNELIQNFQLSTDTTLYLLSNTNSMTIMIFRGKQFLYGTFVNIAKEEDLLDSGFENDTFSNNSMEDEMMDEMMDEIDLDIDDTEDILNILETQSTQIDENEEKVVKIKNKLFGQDLRFVKYLDASLREFYDSDLYVSDFVNKVIVFDAAKLNVDIIKYLEDELLVEIEVIPASIDKVLIDLIKKEVGYFA